MEKFNNINDKFRLSIVDFLNQEIEDYKKVLEEEYGAININVEDGSYTKIEKQETVVAPV